MTAELIEDPGFVRMPLPRGREWTWADLQEIPDDGGHRYEIVDPESVVVDVPFAVEVRPAELVGPRRRD